MKVVISKNANRKKTYKNLPDKTATEGIIASDGQPRSRLLSGDDDWKKNEAAEALRDEFDPKEYDGAAAEFLDDGDDAEFGQTEFEEPEEQTSRWRTSRWVPLVLVGSLIALAVVAYTATSFERDTPLERIRVEGAHQLLDQEIVSLASVDRSQRFYAIDLRKIAANITQHSLIRAVYPRRETSPATLVLAVEERVPVAIMRSQSGETLMIDRDGVLLQPRKLSGLRDPAGIVKLPLISGIAPNDSVAYREMAKLVMKLNALEHGAMAGSFGELRRTPGGTYMLYTLATQTPIFLGAPEDQPFALATEQTTLQRQNKSQPALSQFDRQLALLARAWKSHLADDIAQHPPIYVDVRFAGEVIVKRLGVQPTTTASVSVQSVSKSPGSGTITVSSHHS